MYSEPAHGASGAREIETMKPLSALSPEAARSIRVVLSDIDDTITTEGLLTADAYVALERLHRAGFIVIPVTGRPAGWCDHIARMWPVDAVVGENGAFYFRYDRASKTMSSASGPVRKNSRTTVPGSRSSKRKCWQPCRARRSPATSLTAWPISPSISARTCRRCRRRRWTGSWRSSNVMARRPRSARSMSMAGSATYDKLSMAKVVLADEFGIGWEEAQGLRDLCRRLTQ